MDLLRDGRRRPENLADAMEAIRAIQEVHHVAWMPPPPVELEESTIRHGAYHPTRLPNGLVVPWKITISDRTSRPFMVAAHEYGHFVEHVLPGGAPWRRRRRFKGDGMFSRWLRVARASRLHARWIELRDRIAATTGPAREPRHDIAANQVQYLLSPAEMWANSYAQWAAVRTQHPGLLDDLERKHRLERWQPDDFKPISDAIDEILILAG